MAGVCAVVGLGGGGIGEACAKRFARAGYKIAMMARTELRLKELAKSIPNSSPYVCDVSVSTQVHAVCSKVVADLGSIDVLIYNAGSGSFKPFDDTTEEDLAAAFSAGPGGLFSFAKAVTPAMVSAGSGVIIATGATASWRGMPSTSAFAPAKMAQRGLCQSLARALGPKGIHVAHVVIDGIVDMPKTRAWCPDKPDAEFLDPNAIAETYFAIAKQPASCWTQEINVAPAAIAPTIASI